MKKGKIMSDRKVSRRIFLMSTAATSAGLMAQIGRGPTVSANEKLNIAAIGAGGKGSSDIRGAADAGGNNVVALCDVDWKKGAESFLKFPKAKKYKDFREMLDKEHNNIDAVTISTPDHMHAAAAVACMQLGKHVYVQKPLTHDIYEARRLMELAKEYNVATQMGNQGHSGAGVRRLTEWIRAGAIGTVRETHIWTNRPIWPQAGQRPDEIEPVPETLDWCLWLGVAPYRPYNSCYCPFKWRGWWDFGCGALGDMACHIMDPSYTALNLDYPTTVEAVQEGNTEEMFPKWSIITYQFPARGDRPPVKVVWYDGDKKPPRPKNVPEDETLGDGDNGTLFIGDDGMLACGCYGGSPSLVPRSEMKNFDRPDRTIPNSTGHYQEWIDRIKGIPTTEGGFDGEFDYAGPFTEMVLLGNLAIKAGQKIEYDSKNMKITNVPEANQYLKREYRHGWRDLA